MTLTNGTRTQVQALLPHRRQALYVRSYKVVVPGVSALVEIPLHPKAWYFKGHFPRCPVFPGHAALEALAQAAGLAIAAGYRDKDLDIPAGVFAG